MKKLTKTLKTVSAAFAATLLIPCGLLTAEAATGSADAYAVVRGIECSMQVDGRTLSQAENTTSEADTFAARVPAGSKVLAFCENGEGSVPLTDSQIKVGADFFADPTDVSTVVMETRMAPAAAAAKKPAPEAKKSATKANASTKQASAVSTPVKKAPKAQKTSSSQKTSQVASNNGKVADATTVSTPASTSSATVTTDQETVAAEDGRKGTADQDAVVEEAPVTADAAAPVDNIVDGEQIEAADYAAAHLSAVDRMGGAGTLTGIVILGLIGAAGAISLARSIILG